MLKLEVFDGTAGVSENLIQKLDIFRLDEHAVQAEGDERGISSQRLEQLPEAFTFESVLAQVHVDDVPILVHALRQRQD